MNDLYVHVLQMLTTRIGPQKSMMRIEGTPFATGSGPKDAQRQQHVSQGSKNRNHFAESSANFTYRRLHCILSLSVYGPLQDKKNVRT